MFCWSLLLTGIFALLWHTVDCANALEADLTLDECYPVDVRRECFTYPLNWHTSYEWALKFCTNREAQLVVIRNQQMQSAVEQFASLGRFHDTVLIAATYQNLTQWTWTNHVPFYEGHGPVSNGSATELRVTASLSVADKQVMFNARHPVDSLPYICQYKVGSRFCSSTTHKFENDRQCFVAYIDHPKPWHSARNHCLRNDGDLAVLNDRNDIDHSQLTSHLPYWIGLQHGHWTWPNNEEMTFSNWAPGQPTDAKKQCVVLSTKYSWQWQTADCNEKTSAFVCHIVSPIRSNPIWLLWWILALLVTVFVCSHRRNVARLFLVMMSGR
jgi:hypothetical protein